MRTALVLGRDHRVIAALSEQLASEGIHQLHFATTLAEAQRSLAGSAPDLILVCGEGLIEVARALASSYPVPMLLVRDRSKLAPATPDGALVHGPFALHRMRAAIAAAQAT